MNAVTSHRGPDGSAVWVSSEVTLGHNRLSIIDLRDVANQPFVSDDGRFILVYNGELYNYRELKSELSAFTYRTESDTEVLLNAYRTWGKQCVKRFNGIFAFGIWDKERQELFLARDQFGIKPLYYTESKSWLAFSSEIKSLLLLDIEPVLDHTAFNHYMRLLYTPGEQTLFTGVKRLLPGHTLAVSKGNVHIERYYEVPNAAHEMRESRENLHERIRKALDTSVRRQLVADVPVGVYLSGGIDSTAVLDSVTRVHGSIDTFSIGYDLAEVEEAKKFNADFELAAKTSAHYGTRHHGYKLDSKDVLSLIETSVWHMDEPVANLTALAQMKLAEYAKRDVTVVLGGDGGDELFGGYKRHVHARRLLFYWQLPKALRALVPLRLRKADLDSWAERYMLFLAQKDNILRRILKDPGNDATTAFFNTEYFSETRRGTFLDDMMRADMGSWLVNESLLRSDKMSMAYGLEERVPFLDTEFVELARAIPWDQKTTLFDTKKILKDALRDRLPAHVFNQPKRGWISPAAKWLRRPEVAAYITEVLSPSYYGETAGLFRWEEITRMYAEHRERTAYHLTPLWSVIVFQVWARKFGILVKK